MVAGVALRRIGEPEEVADVVRFLASHGGELHHGSIAGGRRRADRSACRMTVVASARSGMRPSDREMMRLLIADIVSGARPAGEMLPREVDLAAEFGVSRGVARECIRAMEERGLISVRHGAGATVSPSEAGTSSTPTCSRPSSTARAATTCSPSTSSAAA